MNLPLPAGDGTGQGVQQPAAVLDDPAWDRCQLEVGQPGPPRTSPQAPVLTDATVGQHRMDPVLQRGRQADQVARWPSRAPRSRVACGAIQASGNRSARSSWARMAASTLSFFSRARRWPCNGWDEPGAAPAPGPPAARPASPSRRRPRTRPGCRRQRAKDRHQLGRIIGDVTVALLNPGLVDHRDLGALAVQVHPDIDPHQGRLPRARLLPKPRLSG
jgi:hypothetical protein